jgi:hypothetical protein
VPRSTSGNFEGDHQTFTNLFGATTHLGGSQTFPKGQSIQGIDRGQTPSF